MRARILAAVGAAAAVSIGTVAVGLGTAGADAAKPMPAGWPQVAAGAAAPTITGARTMYIVTKSGPSTVVDVGKRGQSPGDYVVFEETLYTRGGTQIGRDSARCMFMQTTYRCDASFLLNGRGKIEVSGSFFGQRDLTLAVTGGTGAYRNARGQATIVGGSRNTTVFRFELLP